MMLEKTVDPSSRDRVYFPELDGLRFVAFALVYLFHGGVPQFASAINAIASRFGFAPKISKTGAVTTLGHTVVSNGWVGVQLFFLLSGFLIATLLLREESRFGRVDLRAFWMRRILRIWPLYYLVVFLTFFLVPLLSGSLGHAETRRLWALHLVPFLFFVGNWSMALLGPAPDTISILWSVCVEEQFYLFCPFLIVGVRPIWREQVVLFLMGAGILARYFTAMSLTRGSISPLLLQFSTLTHLDTLLAGVLLALVARRNYSIPRSAQQCLGIATVIAAIILLSHPNLAHGSALSQTLDFVAIWLVGLALVARSATGRGLVAWCLRYSRLVWLGRISFGLYMFHEIAFWGQRGIFNWLGWFPNQDALAPITAFFLTVALASCSYYLYERPFLRWKSRWSRIASRPV